MHMCQALKTVPGLVSGPRGGLINRFGKRGAKKKSGGRGERKKKGEAERLYPVLPRDLEDPIDLLEDPLPARARLPLPALPPACALPPPPQVDLPPYPQPLVPPPRSSKIPALQSPDSTWGSPPHTRGGTSYGPAAAPICLLWEVPPAPGAPPGAARLIYVPFSTSDFIIGSIKIHLFQKNHRV